MEIARRSGREPVARLASNENPFPPPPAVLDAAILALRGVPPLLTMPVAGVLAALYGLLWGYPCLRLRGQYFAIATIGVGEATRLIMLNMQTHQNYCRPFDETTDCAGAAGDA